MISVDCVLKCHCDNRVQTWFLIHSEDEINSLSPKVRIIRRSERACEAYRSNSRYSAYTDLLDKAELAYWSGLGAESIVYLRKIYEKATIQMANKIGLEFGKHENGNPGNFSKLLKKVDEECGIIPKEFSENGYRLFQELSNVVHGDFDENVGLEKFEALHRLVIGILENIQNQEEYKQTKKQ